MRTAAILEVQEQESIREYLLNGQPVTFGRAADNTVILAGTAVSRHHARIEWEGSQAYLTDLGSANGSSINDSPIPPNLRSPIHPGDDILMGGFRLVLNTPVAGQNERAGHPAGHPNGETSAVLTRVMPASLSLVIETPQGRQEFAIQKNTVSVGRDPSNDISIEHPAVSRHHAKFVQVKHGYEVVDLGSTNGLTFGQARVTKMLAADGDAFSLADGISIVYRITPGAPAVSAAHTPNFEGTPTPAVTKEPVQPSPALGTPAPIEATMMGIETPVAGLQKIDLRGRSSLTIGRSPESDLHLNYPTISRRHARITRSGSQEQYAIEDLGSGNGTLVNDELIEAGKPYPLHAGSTMRIGPIKFIFAPESLQLVDESRDLRLDALNLNQFVSKDLNLLQDISLAILPREYAAVVGVSGAGKSTLLNALAGIRPASDGAILVNGTDLYRHFDAFRTDIGFVPQDDIIHKELTTQKALDYAARLRLPADTTAAERKQAVRGELETLGLTDVKDVPVENLSGGQRKRVSSGGERRTRPGIFFLDEATSGLDPGTENRLMRLLRQLADQGQTIILITHATKNVTLCDQVVFLAKGGHLAYFGPPDQSLAYFGVADFDEIYEKLQDERSPQEWAALYRQSPQYQTYVVQRLQSKTGESLGLHGQSTPAPGRDNARGPKTKSRRPSALRHLTVLSARYIDIIRSDRINLLLLLTIALVLGSMDLIAWPRAIFDPVKGDAARVMVMLFLAAIIPFLVGALSSVREIVKEKAIYQRERTVNLRIIPYLSSKATVGFLFALSLFAALLILKLVAVDLTHMGVQNIALFFVILVLAVMSGVMWGLLVSTIAPREEQAMLLVIVVVVIQMVFSGGILPLDQLGAAGQVIGYTTSSKWTYEALAAVTQVERGECDGPTLDNCLLPGIQAYDTDPEKQVVIDSLHSRYGSVLDGDVNTSIIATSAIMVGLFAVVAVVQKRKDVI